MIVLFLLAANLVGQFFFKYSIYDIPLQEINLVYLGNIFNILLSLLIGFSIFLFYILNRGFDRKEFSFLITVLIFAIVTYFLGYILIKADYDPLNSYIFGLPSRRVYLALLFITNLFFHFYMLAYMWGMIIGRQGAGSLRAFGGAVLAISLTLGFTYYFISSKDYRQIEYRSIPYYDVAVVLGAAVWSNNEPSTIFEGRIKKVYELAKTGKVRKIQLTGGNAPGELSEAEAAKIYLNKLGVSGAFIDIEEETSTTSQQIEFLRDQYSKTIERGQRVVIISDNFHLPRALEMSKFFQVNLNGLASNYELSLDKLLYYRLRESVALLLFWLFGI